MHRKKKSTQLLFDNLLTAKVLEQSLAFAQKTHFKVNNSPDSSSI